MELDHSIAIRDFDGKIVVVEADELRVCVPTIQCFRFWVTVAACFVAGALGVFFMVFQGATSVYFAIGEGLLALAVGILIPGPDYNVLKPQSARSRPSTPQRQDDEHEPKVQSVRSAPARLNELV